jgi:hypothetical protein
MQSLWWIAAVVLACAGAHAHAALAPEAAARILAGRDIASLGQISSPVLQSHAQFVSQSWAEYERRIGAPLRAWSDAEIDPLKGAETVFYPFSGPDFPTVNLVYPEAARYVLVANQYANAPLEIDRLEPAKLRLYLDLFARRWAFYSSVGFFRTDHLDAEAARAGLRVGITDLLMGFAARLGHDVVAVEPIRLRADGADVEPHPGPRSDPATWHSVRLVLKQGRRTRLLDYVRIDLSDGSLTRSPPARQFIERAAANPTLFKAASHLPQRPHFSILREAVLARAPSIWQDETGIDYALLSGAFDVTLYGHYQRAHRLFSGAANASLAAAYASREDIRPIGFRVGYEKQSGSSVQIAVRRDAADASSQRRRMQSLEMRVAAGLERYAGKPRLVYLSRGFAEGSEEIAYLDLVAARIAELGPATRAGAVVSLIVDRDGAVRDATIDRSSGDRMGDALLAEGLKRLPRMPPPPAAIAKRGDAVVLTLRTADIARRL